MPLFVPARVAESMKADQRRAPWRRQARQFDRDLAAIEPGLFCLYAEQDSPMFNLRKGFWYVVRSLGTEAFAFYEVRTPKGEYRDLDSGVLEELRQGDLWNAEVWRSTQRQADARHKALEREKERNREERRERLKDRADFEYRIQVPTRPDGRGRLRTR